MRCVSRHTLSGICALACARPCHVQVTRAIFNFLFFKHTLLSSYLFYFSVSWILNLSCYHLLMGVLKCSLRRRLEVILQTSAKTTKVVWGSFLFLFFLFPKNRVSRGTKYYPHPRRQSLFRFLFRHHRIPQFFHNSGGFDFRWFPSDSFPYIDDLFF